MKRGKQVRTPKETIQVRDTHCLLSIGKISQNNKGNYTGKKHLLSVKHRKRYIKTPKETVQARDTHFLLSMKR